MSTTLPCVPTLPLFWFKCKHFWTLLSIFCSLYIALCFILSQASSHCFYPSKKTLLFPLELGWTVKQKQLHPRPLQICFLWFLAFLRKYAYCPKLHQYQVWQMRSRIMLLDHSESKIYLSGLPGYTTSFSFPSLIHWRQEGISCITLQLLKSEKHLWPTKSLKILILWLIHS